jgi:hypothetical protein
MGTGLQELVKCERAQTEKRKNYHRGHRGPQRERRVGAKDEKIETDRKENQMRFARVGMGLLD